MKILLILSLSAPLISCALSSPSGEKQLEPVIEQDQKSRLSPVPKHFYRARVYQQQEGSIIRESHWIKIPILEDRT